MNELSGHKLLGMNLLIALGKEGQKVFDERVFGTITQMFDSIKHGTCDEEMQKFYTFYAVDCLQHKIKRLNLPFTAEEVAVFGAMIDIANGFHKIEQPTINPLVNSFFPRISNLVGCIMFNLDNLPKNLKFVMESRAAQ